MIELKKLEYIGKFKDLEDNESFLSFTIDDEFSILVYYKLDEKLRDIEISPLKEYGFVSYSFIKEVYNSFKDYSLDEVLKKIDSKG